MQRLLGKDGPAVQPIGLGGMPLSIQGRPDERTGVAVIAAFLAAGGDLIDTAITYCLDDSDLGHNERLIAKALAASDARDAVVATKGGLTRPNGRWEVDGDPRWLRTCCERSVANLGGPIALYYLHAVDPAIPLADSIGALVRLKEEGKIGAIGLSNVDAQQIREALSITPIAAVQNRCNLYQRRDFENGVVTLCADNEIAYVAYSPVGGHHGHRRLAQDPTLVRIAAKHETTPYVVALAWLLARNAQLIAIPGASRVQSARSSLTAIDIALDADDLAALDATPAR
jgi:aryl-alcohol dehydrogenase-like predicted oxidoreductase